MKKLITFLFCSYFCFLSLNLYQSHRWLQKANNYLKENNGDGALKALQISVEKSPFQCVGRYYLAGVYSLKNEPLKAWEVYYDLERKYPYFLLTNYYKSNIAERLKLWYPAYMELLKAEKLYPLDEAIRKEKSKFIVR